MGHGSQIQWVRSVMGRALDDPQKKDLDPDPDPQKYPFNKSHRTNIFCPSSGRRYLMAWTKCNVRPSAAAWVEFTNNLITNLRLSLLFSHKFDLK